jgi:hypothetical protein
MGALQPEKNIHLDSDGELPEGVTETATQEYIVCQHCGTYLPTDSEAYCYNCGKLISGANKETGILRFLFTLVKATGVLLGMVISAEVASHGIGPFTVWLAVTVIVMILLISGMTRLRRRNRSQ